MGNYAIDKEAFENWSQGGCSNSDYAVVVTTCCGAFLVEDIELGDLYWNPEDPTDVVKIWVIQDCPVCGAVQWDFSDALQEQFRECPWVALCQGSKI